MATALAMAAAMAAVAGTARSGGRLVATTRRRARSPDRRICCSPVAPFEGPRGRAPT